MGQRFYTEQQGAGPLGPRREGVLEGRGAVGARRLRDHLRDEAGPEAGQSLSGAGAHQEGCGLPFAGGQAHYGAIPVGARREAGGHGFSRFRGNPIEVEIGPGVALPGDGLSEGQSAVGRNDGEHRIDPYQHSPKAWGLLEPEGLRAAPGGRTSPLSAPAHLMPGRQQGGTQGCAHGSGMQ